MKKQHVLLCDTETDVKGNALDFGAILVDLQGNILHRIAVLIRGYYDNPLLYTLFHKRSLKGIFSPEKLASRYANYDRMLDTGLRTMASVPAINRWLARINATYNPVLTAYNLFFDVESCENIGIDIDQFTRSFCLMHAAQQFYGNKRKYRKFILDNHFFNAPTFKGNMTWKTNAEVMAKYVLGVGIPPEPHTSIEDCVGYELPILIDVIKKNSLRYCLEDIRAGSWERFTVRNGYKVK